MVYGFFFYILAISNETKIISDFLHQVIVSVNMKFQIGIEFIAISNEKKYF